MSSFRLALTFSLVLPFTMFSQDSSKVHFIRASGEASISAKPDRVQISVAVTTQAPSAQTAASQNAERISAVLQALKATVGERGEIQTAAYGVGPHYDFSNGRAPKLNGYQASNTVLVTLRDLSMASKVIDDAMRAGANEINNVEFTIRDRSALYAEALAEATRKARTNAEAIAKALGLTIGGVLEAEPQEAQVVSPRPIPSMAQSVMVGTPVESGNVEVHASVTVSFEVK